MHFYPLVFQPQGYTFKKVGFDRSSVYKLMLRKWNYAVDLHVPTMCVHLSKARQKTDVMPTGL